MDAIKGCILVVEDDPSLGGLIVNALEDEGYCALRARTVREAIKMLNMVKYCTILLDLSLSDRSGAEVVKWVEDAGCGTPIILMTGHSHPKELALELSVASYLPKPFELDELYTAVEGCLQQSLRV